MDNKIGASKETIEELDEGENHENLKKVEAALFISGKFLSLQELVGLTNINPLILRKLLEKLEEKYSKENTSIEIIRKSDLWKMDVAKDYMDITNRLATGEAEFTKAEQETLAVIAYKQPVKQSVIIKIRGNKAYDHIKKFKEIGLLRAKKIGHTYELDLSQEFFDYFSLTKKEQLNN